MLAQASALPEARTDTPKLPRREEASFRTLIDGVRLEIIARPASAIDPLRFTGRLVSKRQGSGVYFTGTHLSFDDEGMAPCVWIESAAIDIHPSDVERAKKFIEAWGGRA